MMGDECVCKRVLQAWPVRAGVGERTLANEEPANRSTYVDILTAKLSRRLWLAEALHVEEHELDRDRYG